ncbi:MAG: hypothetical protein ACTSX2_12870 [Candidatus Thorarchaeota archaeon]
MSPLRATVIALVMWYIDTIVSVLALLSYGNILVFRRFYIFIKIGDDNRFHDCASESVLHGP